MRGRSPGHRGVLAGEVVRLDRGARGEVQPVVRLATALKPGDGVAFDAGTRKLGLDEAGGRVYEVTDAATGVALTSSGGGFENVLGREVVLGFANGALADGSVHAGDIVWRSHDASALARARALAKTPADERSNLAGERAVTARVSGRAGEPLRIELEGADGSSGGATSDVPLEAARSAPLGSSELSRAIGTLVDRGLHLASIEERLGGDDVAGGSSLDALAARGEPLFLPTSQIKRTRRAAADALLAAREDAVRARAQVAPRRILNELLETTLAKAGKAAAAAEDDEGASAPRPMLSVLCRTQQQAEAALRVDWLEEVVLDFLEVHGLEEAVRAVQAAGRRAVVATPRVLKPNEERLWRFYLRLRADALLVRSSGLLRTLTLMRDEQLRGDGDGDVAAETAVPELRGDASLNAANEISVGALLARGLTRLAPAHDLSAKQISTLARGLGPRVAGSLEVVLHQHLPVFHTEHCVFCRFLSDGNSYKDCGHPCEMNTVHLRDAQGSDHLVLADMGCRNTVFSAQAQSGVQFLPRLLSAGVRRFRIELVDEPAEAVGPLLASYMEAIAEPERARAVYKSLRDIPDANGNAQGVTLGSLGSSTEIARREMKPTKASGLATLVADYE